MRRFGEGDSRVYFLCIKWHGQKYLVRQPGVSRQICAAVGNEKREIWVKSFNSCLGITRPLIVVYDALSGTGYIAKRAGPHASQESVDDWWFVVAYKGDSVMQQAVQVRVDSPSVI